MAMGEYKSDGVYEWKDHTSVTTAPGWQEHWTAGGVVSSGAAGQPHVTKEMLEVCAVCGADCEWVLCDVCKLAISELRDKVLEAIARTIEEDLA